MGLLDCLKVLEAIKEKTKVPFYKVFMQSAQERFLFSAGKCQATVESRVGYRLFVVWGGDPTV